MVTFEEYLNSSLEAIFDANNDGKLDIGEQAEMLEVMEEEEKAISGIEDLHPSEDDWEE